MNIDFIEAKKEIEKIFKDSHFDRKIVFWYDEGKNFYESVKNHKFNNVETIIYENNPFKIKYYIEVENKETNILIYLPISKPIDTENWLLDILLYSEEYYADTVALTMRRLDLTNSDLRNVVGRHIKFFNSEVRVSSLKKLITLSNETREKDFILGMMAVLVKAKFNKIEYILTELVFDDEEEFKYNELVKYGFEEELWNYISEFSNYSGIQNIKELIKRFLMTSVYRSSNLENLPPFQQSFVIEDGVNSGAADAEIFITSIKYDQRYAKLQEKYQKELRLEELVRLKGIEDFSSCDVFEIFDFHIIKTIIESINSGSIDYSFFENIIDFRINSIWYEGYQNQYSVLKNSIKFKRLTQNGIKQLSTAEEYINYYEETLYKVDMLYRHIVTDYKNIKEPSQELAELINNIDIIYENVYLANLGEQFFNVFNKKEKWEFSNAPMSRDFYNEIQAVNYKKMFVIISDALRYEIGVELLNEIEAEPRLGGTVNIKPMISPLPSETRFGMASLLPNRNIIYESGNLFVDDMPTNGTKNREKILKNKNETFAAITYEDINNFTREELRKYMQDKTLVYIYHNTIDKMGENNESKVFEASKEAIEELLLLVKKLYNNLQISNYIITADHGFIYKRKKVEESQKYSNIYALKSKETSKRYLLTDEIVEIPYTKEFESYGINVVVPSSYDIFKTPGGSTQYIHGGASLQEIIIPLIKVSELRSKKHQVNHHRLE